MFRIVASTAVHTQDVWEGFGVQAIRPWIDPRIEDLRLKDDVNNKKQRCKKSGYPPGN